MSKKEVIFIVGPTATGKSQVAYLLAKRLKAEIVSCDSMLVYKEPEILTAKPAQNILSEIAHHFINLISISEKYSVYDYCQNAAKRIESLYKKNIPVIVCGGTGLYYKALLDGIFAQAKKDDNLRKELDEQIEKEGLQKLYQQLKAVDPEAAEKISQNDRKRIIRALEVYRLTGEPISVKKKEAKGLWGKIPVKVFGLRLNRDKLYEKINKRVDKMFELGAVDEVKGLLNKKISMTAEKIIGIKEIKDYLNNKGDSSHTGTVPLVEEAKEKIKQNTRRFAKRQITWFKKDSRIEWIDAEGKEPKGVADTIRYKVQETITKK
ncbi:MAG: tRNA (adenosine(37)-N6)-dimethylallyltransferase MiaA [Candidatus Omnitrophica bacterium]|nr:tRNA (adenosine(37)-N6)-dimethylallyltransferase MiaA [Candidatus Omnitrophota bacterium]MCF7878849.1 tRNA (adenosine(37)-N6)-dimethylallyltransferase MiaA [Candidatus Omnitrophota bacterium]MCF7893426.1 tRNA (adenosine(37)-N6)-dimethylallyltransferase MiaA [Candidatus Omnitrophota bacterium]